MTKMKKGFWAIALVAATILVVGAGTASFSNAADTAFTIRGSTTVLPIAQNAAEIYMDRHDEVDISVQGGGSGVGVASIIDGTCDIADSSRAVKEKEIKEAAEKGVDLKAQCRCHGRHSSHCPPVQWCRKNIERSNQSYLYGKIFQLGRRRRQGRQDRGYFPRYSQRNV